MIEVPLHRLYAPQQHFDRYNAEPVSGVSAGRPGPGAKITRGGESGVLS
jgi:hypothetical protein